MPEQVTEATLFHVTRKLIYNSYEPLQPGSTIAAGPHHNPFFGFYERQRTLPVTMPDGQVINYAAVTWIRAVRDGHLNPGNLRGDAYDLVMHFQMLSRELIMEMTRLETAPTAPSRLRCLWTVTSLNDARRWLRTLGGEGRILELSATGVIATVDSKLLVGDSEPFSQTQANARRYWHEEQTNTPDLETLFEGTAVVRSVRA